MLDFLFYMLSIFYNKLEINFCCNTCVSPEKRMHTFSRLANLFQIQCSFPVLRLGEKMF